MQLELTFQTENPLMLIPRYKSAISSVDLFVVQDDRAQLAKADPAKFNAWLLSLINLLLGLSGKSDKLSTKIMIYQINWF